MAWTPKTGKQITEPNRPAWAPKSGRQVPATDDILLDQLEGSTRIGKPPERVIGYGAGSMVTTNPDPYWQRRYERRQGAMAELQRRGYDPEQLDVAVTARNLLRRDEIGRTLGAAAGSLALPALVNLIPGMAAAPEEAITVPLGLRLARYLGPTAAGIAGAGGGGAVGKGVETGLIERRAPTAKELLHAAVTEAAFEAGTRGAIKGAKTLASPFIKRTAPAAARTIDDYARAGGFYTPAQRDDRITLRALEAVSRGSFGGQQIFDKFGEMQQKSLAELAAQMVDDLAGGAARLGDAELGQLLMDTVQRPGGAKWTMVDELVEPLYGEVRKRAARATVNVGPLKEYARSMLGRDLAAKNNLLTDVGRQRLRKIAVLDDRTPFNTLRDIRSSLLKEERKLALEMNQDAGMIRHLAGLANDAVYDARAVQGLDATGRRLLHKANRLYRAASEQWEQTFPKRILASLERNPQRAPDVVFPKRNERYIQGVRQMLTRTPQGVPDPEGQVIWDRLRQAWLADIVGKSTSEGVLNPRTFERKLADMGDAALQQMFRPEELQRIRNIGVIAERIRSRGASGTTLFSKGMQIGQFGQAAALVLGGTGGSGISILGGGAIAVSPIFYAKLATSREGAQLLAKGMTVPKGTKEVAILAARMVRLLRQIETNEQNMIATGQRREQARQQQQETVERFKAQPSWLRRSPQFLGGHHF